VYVFIVFVTPRAVQAAGLVGLYFRYEYVDAIRRESECLGIVLHRLCGIEEELPSVGEPDREQISVSPLASPAAGVNDEVFDLEKTVQSKIPIGDFLWIEPFGLLNLTQRHRRAPFPSVSERARRVQPAGAARVVIAGGTPSLYFWQPSDAVIR
jgi:hypothetical protein